jgi:acyl-coenzyme A thioesterase PaaI-like protein
VHPTSRGVTRAFRAVAEGEDADPDVPLGKFVFSSDGNLTTYSMEELLTLLDGRYVRPGTGDDQVRTNSDLDSRYVRPGTQGDQVRTNSELDGRFVRITGNGAGGNSVLTQREMDARYVRPGTGGDEVRTNSQLDRTYPRFNQNIRIANLARYGAGTPAFLWGGQQGVGINRTRSDYATWQITTP